MGNCCGQDTGNPLELQISNKVFGNTFIGKLEKARNHKFNLYKFGERSSLINSQSVNYEVERNTYTPLINDIISRYNSIDLEYSSRETRIQKERFIEKLRSDQLFNIFSKYKNDFTESEYIIYDLRETKKHSFIKKCNQLNFSVKDLQNGSNSLLKRVKKYLDKKKLIILIDKPQLIADIEELIILITKNNFDTKIKLFDNDLNKEASISTATFSDFLDKRICNHLPFIFAQLQHFPHMGSNKFVFINYKVNINDYCSSEKEKNLFTYSETSNFINFYSLHSFILITKEKGISVKLKALNQDIIYLTRSIIIDNISSLEHLEKKNYEILEAIGIMLCAIEDENSGLILIDEKIKEEVLNLLMYIFIRKLIKIPPKMISSMLIDNPLFPSSFLNEINTNQDKFEKFLIRNLDKVEKSILDRSSDKKNNEDNLSELISNNKDNNRVSTVIIINNLIYIDI